jgi:transcriptional regulator
MTLLQGTLDLVVLKALIWGPMHGYGISVLVHERTKGEITIVDAALYKALYRLERDELVTSAWGVSDNNRRAKFYRLTQKGRHGLQKEIEEWEGYTAAINRLVKST